MDRGAWQATVHTVAKSQTQLKRLTMHAQPKDSFLFISDLSSRTGMSWSPLSGLKGVKPPLAFGEGMQGIARVCEDISGNTRLCESM